MLENLKEVLSQDQLQELENFIETEKVNAREGLIDNEQLQKQIQSEADKVRTDYSKKVKELENELQGLKPIQKTDAELELEAKLVEMQVKEKELLQKERYIKTVEVLEQNNIPQGLAKYINIDIDNNEIIEEFKGVLNNTILNNSYKHNQHKSNAGMTKEEFAKLNYTERTELFKTNPDLYAILSK